MIKKALIVLLWLAGFNLYIYPQNTNIDKNLLSRTERALNFSALQELTGSVYLTAERFESGKKPRAVIRLCSKESIEPALLKSALSFPTMIISFNSLGFSGENIIVLKSPDCISKAPVESVTVPTEIYAVPPGDDLPSYSEKYISDEIIIKDFNRKDRRYTGTLDYLKNAGKFIKELQKDVSAQGVIFGAYCSDPKEINVPLLKVSNLLKKSAIKETQYKVQKFKWVDLECSESPGKPHKFPALYLIRIVTH